MYTMRSLSLAAALLLAVASSLAAPTSPGETACNTIVSALGEDKVKFPGPLSLEYQQARLYYNTRNNAMSPSCVVFPLNAHDVSVAVKAIRKADATFAVKAGGHNPSPGFSSVDGGVLINLFKMTDKSYDPVKNYAIYEPGPRWGELYSYFNNNHGHVPVGGRIAGVGSGLALGGGLSYLSGQYGLAADSFRELEVVLPSGEITTASATHNPELFWALKGAGYSKFGIVTKYTVQARPSGKFFAGNIIYALGDSSDKVLDATYNFARYSTDPKSAIIGTYLKLSTPDLGPVNLDEFSLLFVVHDGEKPGSAYDNFTSVPHLLDTRAVRDYPGAANLVPFGAEGSAALNTFRNAAIRLNDNSYREAYLAWSKWSDEHKGQYLLTSIDYQPVQKSLTDAAKAQGGNALGLPDGPWMWLNFLLMAAPGLSEAQYQSLSASFKQLVDSIPQAKDLPLFPNDSAGDQPVFQSWTTHARVKKVQKHYDPDGFFLRKTGGFSFA